MGLEMPVDPEKRVHNKLGTPQDRWDGPEGENKAGQSTAETTCATNMHAPGEAAAVGRCNESTVGV